MDLDPRLLEQIKDMDAKELDKKIAEISSILNVNPNLIKKMVGDPEQLRKKLGSINEKDLQRLSRKIDPKKLQQIKDTFE